MDAALDRILAHDVAGFAAPWAPDGTMTLPFAAPGSPRAEYTLRYVAVVTVGPEGITGHRDCWSPLEVQQVFGRTGLAEAAR